MMHAFPLLALCILHYALCISVAAAVPRDWVADVARPSIAPLAVKRGETASLRCTLVRDGKPWDPAAETATLHWQTNGMRDLWWSAPAVVASNVLSATWTPAMDPGASPVSLFIGAADAGGDLVYAAEASLRILHAPGAIPNELPIPVPTIDFATVAVTNAPWALASDVPVPDYSATNAALVSTIQAVAPAPGDYATVSNRAMTALQSYTETDPLVPAWAKAENKPSYTASEVGAAATQHTHPTTDVTGLADALAGKASTQHTHQQSDVTGLADVLAGKAATNHGHRLEWNYPSLYTDQPEGTMFKSNNKNEVVPAVRGTDYAAGIHTHATSHITNFPSNVSYFWNDAGYLTAHQSLAGYATTAALGAAATAATNYTDAAIAAATPSAPTWDTDNVGANPTVALAVQPNTAYMRTGSGTLTLSAVSGLSPVATYCVFSGFDALVLPAGFDVAGSGAFRAGREVHLALWRTPSTNLVEFLFAR